jgi:hypothetical protein
VVPVYVYLPLVVKNFGIPTSADDIANGDFESGSDGSWTEYSSHGWDLIVTTFPGSVVPHSGSWAVWLGGEYDDISYVQQDVTVLGGSSILSFWYWIASADLCGYDYGSVRINGATVQSFDLCDSNDTGAWVQGTVNLSAYSGQTVALQIRAETDGSLNSNFFIDDVALGAALLLEGKENVQVPTPVVNPASESPRQ